VCCSVLDCVAVFMCVWSAQVSVCGCNTQRPTRFEALSDSPPPRKWVGISWAEGKCGEGENAYAGGESGGGANLGGRRSGKRVELICMGLFISSFKSKGVFVRYKCLLKRGEMGSV